MNYKDIDDGELFMLVCEDDENAKELLFNKYKYIIDLTIKKYSYSAKLLGIDYKDMYGEALIGFTDAINNYNEAKNANLNTFITRCVNSRLKKYIIHNKTLRNRINSETFSLDHIYDEFGISLSDMVSDNNQNDPLHNMLEEESTKELIELIKKELSDFENQVFDLLISDFNYTEIASILEKNPKQIDNTMQRIKGKVKRVLSNKNAV